MTIGNDPTPLLSPDLVSLYFLILRKLQQSSIELVEACYDTIITLYFHFAVRIFHEKPMAKWQIKEMSWHINFSLFQNFRFQLALSNQLFQVYQNLVSVRCYRKRIIDALIKEGKI